MNRLSCVVFAMAWTLAAVPMAAAETVIRVPDDHATIQAALDAAPDFGTVRIREGNYSESIMASRPVSLVGEGEVIVRAIDRERPVLTLYGVPEGFVRGVIFESIGPRPTQRDERVTDATVVVIGGAPVFEECVIRNGSHSGVKVGGETTVVFRECVFEGHGQSGAFVMGDIATPRFENCRFSTNRWNGITFADGARGELIDCEVEHNGSNGISLLDPDTAPIIRGVESRGNRFNGIVIMDGAGGTVEDSTFSGNGASGINLQKVSSALIVRGNRATENAFSGFHLAQPTDATIERNRFVRNGVVSSGEVSLMVRDEDFEGLDELEAHLRENEVRFESGAWQLNFFYGYLQGGWQGTPQSQRMSFEEWCGRWQYGEPHSPAARIARARWHMQEAVTTRGRMEPEQVSDAAWETYAHHLAEAHGALHEALEHAPGHPQAYTELVHLLGTVELLPEAGAEAREAVWAALEPAMKSSAAIFAEGAAATPGYLPLYTARGRFLLPQWENPPTAIVEFAARSADDTSELLGEGIYAVIANDVLHSFYLWTRAHEFFREFAFEWPRIVQGHRDLIEQTPASSYWKQSLVLFAGLQGDKALAAELFDELEEDETEPDTAIWQSEDAFATYRDWALHEGPYPEASAELLMAIQMGNPDAVSRLLVEGAVVNAVGHLGYAPLTFAVDRFDAAIADLLLEAGADPEFQLYKGVAPIHKAAANNAIPILESLLDHGASADFVSEDGSNALMYAAYSGHVNAIQTLLRHGATVDLRHPSGSTAFIVAVRQGHVGAAGALVAAGADPTVVTDDGESALDIARANGFAEIADWLENEVLPAHAATDAQPASGLGTELEADDGAAEE